MNWVVRLYDHIASNTLHLLIVALLIFVITILLVHNVDSIGDVKFRRDSKLEFLARDIDDAYWQVYRDAKTESRRTNALVKRMVLDAFSVYFGDSLQHEKAIYSLIVDDVFDGVVTDFTINSVFRNHFPKLSDTTAVNKHVARISDVVISISSSHITQQWYNTMPCIDRMGFYRHLDTSGVIDDIRTIKQESLIRTEVLKMEVVNNLIAVYPWLTCTGVKRRWSGRR